MVRKLRDLSFVPLADAKKEFSAVVQSSQEEEIIITKNGKPVSALMSYHRYVQIMEFLNEIYDLYLMDVGSDSDSILVRKRSLDELLVDMNQSDQEV